MPYRMLLPMEATLVAFCRAHQQQSAREGKGTSGLAAGAVWIAMTGVAEVSAAMGEGVGGSLKSCPKGNARPDLVARTVMNLLLVAKMAGSS